MENILCIYLIDDNEVDRLISETLLIKIIGSVKIFSFVSAEQALQDLAYKATYQPEDLPQLLLLDLDMPVTNGWEFLEKYNLISETFPNYHQRPEIYILTASINPLDLSAARANPLVADLLTKPFTVSAVEKIKRRISSITSLHKSSVENHLLN
jgi:CheY-like chemotaxis protein